jgi:hypothetical protein
VVANEERGAYLKAAQLGRMHEGHNPLPQLHAAAVYQRALCHVLEVRSSALALRSRVTPCLLKKIKK